MTTVASVLNKATGGRVTPAAVTWTGFVMHVPIALLIANGQLVWAAILLVVFGLFDALDGALARLQNSASVKGMLLDASTDRMKEVLLYAGVAYYFAVHGYDAFSFALVVIALGASMSVSYVKAKGEAAVASGGKKIPHAKLNRMFADGVLTFEMRMTVLILGLLTDLLVVAVAVIAVLATYTAFQRLIRISRSL